MIDPKADQILVTGSNGFIGASVVEHLIALGLGNIRCLVRDERRADRLRDILYRNNAGSKCELMVGDLTSVEDCNRAADQVTIAYHLAAGFDRSYAEVHKNSVVATQNLLTALLEHGRLRRFVCVSSFSVYSNRGMKRGAMLDETCPIEDGPVQRFDAYAAGKIQQERIVREYCRNHGLPFVILRPGTVFGPGKRDLTGRIGIRASRIFFLVSGSNLLPLTYVDNCADAIIAAGFCANVEGKTFNVVDDNLISTREFLNAYHKRVGGLFCVPVPYRVAQFLCCIAEVCGRALPMIPKSLNSRRCAVEWKGNRYSNGLIKDQLGWEPRISMEKAMKLFLEQY
jgi:nucleoside-diphosphate-sugar epimerase